MRGPKEDGAGLCSLGETCSELCVVAVNSAGGREVEEEWPGRSPGHQTAWEGFGKLAPVAVLRVPGSLCLCRTRNDADETNRVE